MKKKKIIFIGGTPQSKVNSEKLDIYWFIQRNIDIEYWNLTNIFYTKEALDLYFGGHPDYKDNGFPKEIKFNKIKNTKEALAKVSRDTLFCSLDGFMQSSFWLLRSFKKYNLHYYIGPWRTTHAHEIDPDSFFKKLIKAILNGAIFEKLKKSTKTNISNPLVYKLKRIIYSNTSYYQKPDFVIGIGSLGRKECCNVFETRNFISIKSNDVSWDKLPSLLNHSYCVYVDESIIYSPNTGLNEITKNNSTSNDFDQFKSNICRVFDLVEKKLGVKVVIALSGKFKYEDETIYGDREMIYGKTNQLIQHSDLVLGHASSGIYQSIIDRKPLILLNDQTFISDKQSQIPPIAEWLNVKCILTTKFSPTDLNNLDKNLLIYKKIEEQYFAENKTVKDYRKVILRRLNNLVSHE